MDVSHRLRHFVGDIAKYKNPSGDFDIAVASGAHTIHCDVCSKIYHEKLWKPRMAAS